MSDEFSESELNSILTRVDGWYRAFAQSPEFAGLSSSQQSEAGAITEFFARHTYEYLGLSPDEWDRSAVAECCTEILPRKVTAERSFFEAVAPVLSRFFRFLEHQSLLPKAGALAKAVDGLGTKIVEGSKDRSHWGPAKHLAMAALDDGVDLTDRKALDAFISKFNQQQADRLNSRSARSPEWLPFLPPAEVKPKLAPPGGGPYAPCPCGSGKKYKFCCKPAG